MSRLRPIERVLVALLLLIGVGTSAPAWGRDAGSDAAIDTGIVGSVVDSLSRDPVVGATVRVRELGRARVTDLEGRFRFPAIEPGQYTIEVRHVAFRPLDTPLFVVVDHPALDVTIALSPRFYSVGEIVTRDSTLTVLTGAERAAYTAPRSVLAAFPIDELVDILELLPGVLVNGGRPFFRGVGFEQVTPLLDGVPAREPILGEWILPPPNAILNAELVSEAIGAEAGFALAGVMNFRLAEGGEVWRGRARVDQDRLTFGASESRRTDVLELSASGPTPIRPLLASFSYQGQATDTELAFDHARPEQTILGLRAGRRMNGREVGSAKFTLRPVGRSWKAAASVTHAEHREKRYHDSYSRRGWVGVDAALDRYTTYLSDPADADSAVYFDAPAAIPTFFGHSTLAIATYQTALAPKAHLRLHLVYGHHRRDTGFAGRHFDDDGELREWVRTELTSPAHQLEWYYATHGYAPQYDWRRSDEGGLGAALHLHPAPEHDFKVGSHVMAGSHRAMWIRPPLGLGSSFDYALHAVDGYSYIEDTWRTDRFSSLQLSMRHVYRNLDRAGRRLRAARWAPAVRFQQPMTDADAMHVQAGVNYQFPTLQGSFVDREQLDTAPALVAQKLRFFEAGLQHHFSRALAAYLGGYWREYSDVVFATRTPTEFEAAFGSRNDDPVPIIESTGVEAVLDHRVSIDLIAQYSFTLSGTDLAERQAPWSRRAHAQGWMHWTPRAEFEATAVGRWQSGQPYSICIESRGCSDRNRIEGRLPHEYTIDLAGHVVPRRIRRLRLALAVRNLLGSRFPRFDFGTAPMAVRADNFIAYYDREGSPDGYILRSGQFEFVGHVKNPAARSEGRSVRLSATCEF